MYANIEYDNHVDSKPSQNETGPRNLKRRFHGAVVLCLGVLSVFLLAGLISLCVYHRDSVTTIKANLIGRLSSVTEERDRLNASLSNMTKELDRLRSLSKQSCGTSRWNESECTEWVGDIFQDDTSSSLTPPAESSAPPQFYI